MLLLLKVLAIFLAVVVLILMAVILAMGIALFIMWKATKKTILINDAMESNYQQLILAFDASVKVVGGPLYQYLEQLKRVEHSIIYNDAISNLYKRILEAQLAMYNVLSDHNLITKGAPLPQYLKSSQEEIEGKFINVKSIAENTPEFRRSALSLHSVSR